MADEIGMCDDVTDASPTTAPDLILTGQFSEEETQTFRHVPFTVPAGLTQIHLRATYNDQIDSSPLRFGGNTLDIGLFDERGTAAGGDGFRGWSGSSRAEITIGSDWATPPYRAGQIGAGEWHVLLGAYKIGPNGLVYTVEVWFDPDLPDPSPLPLITSVPHRDPLPAPLEPGWYRGDLHLHTIYSDGSGAPAQVSAAAAAAGLDFIGITDHNRAQSPSGLVPEGEGWPLLVPGVEVTTYAGHFNVWGTDAWFDFRDPSEEGVRGAMEAAVAAGGLISVNHPKPFGPPWEYPALTTLAHGIEVWNGWWSRLNHVSVRYWDERLRRGERHVALAGSDMHKLGLAGHPDDPLAPAKLGHPTLWVHVAGELTITGVLDAVRAGRSFISDSPAGPQLYLTRNADTLHCRVGGGRGDALLLVADHGIVSATPVTDDDQFITVPVGGLPDSVTYVRAELHRAAGGIRALTNPSWLSG
ncbi:MAG: CehA/McbA family metallohydrolase [Chloroflexota bacterium]|nr:CehA/McbA family metallohydrolase [Chloroflexota bacterium]